MDLETAATTHRLRTIKLEDGEVVIPLQGHRKKKGFPSDNPHAGVWGKGIWYALAFTKRPDRTAGAALAHDIELNPRLADDCVMVHGSPGAIISLITKGPRIFRARTRRTLSPEVRAKAVETLAKHSFTRPRADKRPDFVSGVSEQRNGG